MTRDFREHVGAVAVLALSTGLAAAAPAEVERTGNVRSGPGPGYRVVATLPAGSVVDVGSCTGSWCRVAFEGGEGYMARSLLALGAAPPAVAVGPVYDDDYYDDYPFYGYAYGPSVGFIHRRHRHHRPGHWGHHRPGRPGWGGRPPVGGNPGGGAPKIGQSVRPGGFSGGGSSFGGGAKASGSFGGGGGARGAVSAPASSAASGSGGGKLR